MTQVPVQLVCGHEHALCLVAMTMRDGTVKNIVYAWGDESRGQLGSGDAHTRFKPQENRWVSKLLIKYAFTAVQVREYVAYLELWLFVDSYVLLLSCSITSGTLGSPVLLLSCSIITMSLQITIITIILTMTCLSISLHLQRLQIACGGWHNLLLSSSGQVVSWGAGDYGQLGHGDMWDNPYPKVINDLKGVIALDGGARHSVAIVQKVGVLSWGYNG